MVLDVDIVAKRDPAYLFDHQAYRATGALFWPDPFNDGWIADELWNWIGVQP
jgi:hypothetical protein